ncbi:MAG TPA: 3-dehydroquinate synthase [Firmicutes bacterium]|nr:3-dehydroquinate synthase [Bacillota bacterium]
MNIALAGPMASGKTTVGLKLARRLGIPFIDVDQFIEETTGKKVADIFRESGEPHFRSLEEAAIERLSSLPNAVIALGGGAVVSEKNRDLLASRSTVIMLLCSPEEILRRVGRNSSRPLLAAPDRLERIKALLKEREDYYRFGDYSIDTTGLAADDVVERIIGFLSATTDTRGPGGERTTGRDSDRAAGMPNGRVLHLRTSSPYPVYVGHGVIHETGSLLSAMAPERPRTILVSNPVVHLLYGAQVRDSLMRAGFDVQDLVIPDGEQFKDMARVMSAYDFMASRGMGRDTVMIALGGGVVGDLAGFVAATYMRGIRLVQVPTTLLAQVDSSVGGKVGVNHPRAKNLIGAFHQPIMVVADTSALLSLPEREYREGLSEVVKYGVIWDASFFEFLERNVDRILNRETGILADMVYRCCEIKGDVVSQDERENGIRAILNFGHTTGHAIEALAGYGELRHGEAVSIGMAIAARIACRLGLVPVQDVERLTRLLERLGLPTSLASLSRASSKTVAGPGTAGESARAIMEYMTLDKKARSGRIRFVLPRRIGEVLVQEVNHDVIREVLECPGNSWT